MSIMVSASQTPICEPPPAVAQLTKLLSQLEAQHSGLPSEAASEAVAHARQLGDPTLLARALSVACRTLQDSGELDRALAIVVEAEELVMNLGDLSSQARAYYDAGSVLWRLERMSEALRYMDLAQCAAGQVNDLDIQVQCFNGIGLIFTTMRSFAMALTAFDRGLAICDRDRLPVQYLRLVNNKAQVLIHQAAVQADSEGRKFDIEAIGNLFTCDVLAAMEAAPPIRRRRMLDTVAQWRRLRGEAVEALEILERNLTLAKESGDVVGIPYTNVGIAETLLVLGRPTEAIAVGQPALDAIAGRLESDAEARGRLVLAEAYAALGQHEHAYTSFKQYNALVNRINDAASVHLARHMQATIELTQSRAENETFRRLNDQLIGAKDAAEAASRAKSDFLSNMSHELRTPLNAIIGFSDLMISECLGPLPPRYREYVSHVFTSGHHLLALINQVLDLAKAEAGKLELDETVFELFPLIQDVCHLLHHTAASGGVALVGPSMHRASIKADALKLKQCVINIVSNALKFTPRGGSVTVTLEPNSSGIDITVADTGKGIPTSEIETVFNRFGQGSNAQGVSGTGIGLPLTRELMGLHGGEILFQSILGKGTTVTLRLPRFRLVDL
jgi:signal transduction histidine kinase